MAASLRPQGGEPREMYIEGPLAKDVAAWGARGSLAEAGQERPHDEEAGPVLDDQLCRRHQTVDAGGIDAQAAAAIDLRDPGSEAAQDIGHDAHVVNAGHTLQEALLRSEESGGPGRGHAVLG